MREAERGLMWKLPYYARRYDAPATYVLLALMGAAFIAGFLSNQALTGLLYWSPSIDWLRGGPYWQPFTFPFAHPSILGLLFDGLLLYFFGASLERAWGSAKFLFFFCSTGIIAGIVLIPQTALSTAPPLFAGMAGSFVGITVAFAAMNPYATLLFWFVPMQARWMAVIIVAFDVFGNAARYGGPIQSVIAVAVVCVYAYLFATRRASLPSLRSGAQRGPSLKDRFDRWQQRRRMRQWQRRVSKIDRPEDLFKDK